MNCISIFFYLFIMFGVKGDILIFDKSVWLVFWYIIFILFVKLIKVCVGFLSR